MQTNTNYEEDDTINHITFCRFKKHEYEYSSQYIFLLSKFCNFNIFDIFPKLFTISTKNGSYHFNIELLQDTSSVIYNHLQENPNILQYYLNIDDEENVLGKFEKLYNGNTIAFGEADLLSSREITKLLQIKNCPDYLKPPSLFNEEPNIRYKWSIEGVEMDRNSLHKFLLNKNNRSFTIITKRKEYKCNKFGIHSSKIIHEILEKDPTTNRYIYDYEDEDDEFQMICDIFNFKPLNITRNNMHLLKEIAEDLQIDSIQNQINNYIKKYENISQDLDDYESIINSIDQLFDWLYKIQEITVQNVKNLIIDSTWVDNEENVQELAAFILQVIKNEYRIHKEIIDLIIQLNENANEFNSLHILLPFIIRIALNYFSAKTKNEDKFIFLFIRTLYKRGLIPKEKIIENLQRDCMNNKFKVAFFFPELIEIDPKANFLSQEYTPLDGCLRKFVEDYLPNKIELYEKMLEQCEADDELTKYLRIDDVDNLQSIIMRCQIDIKNFKVPYNIFDDFDEALNLINYAALYGSIKCFKYLLLNDADVDIRTLYYAYYGGNIEIIKIVNQRIPIGNDKCTIDIINILIKKHRNELFDWILNQNFIKSEDNIYYFSYFACISASNGNAHSLIELIDNGLDISSTLFIKIVKKASKGGFYKLTLLLMKFISKNTKKDSIFANSHNFYFTIIFGNLSIFKLFLTEMNKHDAESAAFKAFYMNHYNILDYYINYALDKRYEFSTFYINEILKYSTKNMSEDYILYLIEKFQSFDRKDITESVYSSSLNTACLHGKLTMSKIYAELILKKNKKYDFQNAFFNAFSSGSFDICKYFLEKCFIDYSILSRRSHELGSISVELLSIILQKVEPLEKKNFMKCIYDAIRKKNKSLVEFLLKEKASYKRALIESISINDLEIFNLILDHDSSPSFVNRNFSNGTALLNAVEKNNLNMVKRLLSIPGINPNLYKYNEELPITVAISNCNLEIVNAILNFYGDNIQSNIWLLSRIMSELLKLDMNEPIIEIVKRIFQIKALNPNFTDHHALLYKACMSNNVEIVELLLKSDKIDVNGYENGNTSLIIALENNNINIAKMLIKYPKTNINERNYVKETALTIATQKEQYEIIDLIINDERFDPDESNLNCAFYYSNNEISKLLATSTKLDVNYTFKSQSNKINRNDIGIFAKLSSLCNSEAETPLIQSLDNYYYDKFDLIINHPSFDKSKSKIFDAILASIKKQNIPIFKKLLELLTKDELKIFIEKNMDSYHFIEMPIEFITIFLNHPLFNPNSRIIVDIFCHYGKSYLFMQKERLQFILNYDEQHANMIDINMLFKNDISLLFSISEEIIKSLIISNKIDVQQKINGKTYLHFAASHYCSKYLKMFLDLNVIDINSLDNEGETPLFDACKHKNKDSVSLLFEKDDLDYLHKNHEGKDALQIIAHLSEDEYNYSIKSKSNYLQKLISIFNRKKEEEKEEEKEEDNFGDYSEDSMSSEDEDENDSDE